MEQYFVILQHSNLLRKYINTMNFISVNSGYAPKLKRVINLNNVSILNKIMNILFVPLKVQLFYNYTF